MKTSRLLCLILIFPLLFSVSSSTPAASNTDFVNAVEHGLSTENSGEKNSVALQDIIDSLSESGGTVYIPAGRYKFAENGSQTIGTHCIKMRSNVSIVGDGADTVLEPVGESLYGLDMFYFNDYVDTGEAVYLENCRFEGFTIDASATSCKIYTSAGKGFMFNLFRNCHWSDVAVKYTDATGFGVDCPIDSTIKNCTAIGCGKAAAERGSGASGFGIGFGYTYGESILISDCTARDNKNFGFFIEHQGRFSNEKYKATDLHSFVISDCRSYGDLFGFGGIHTLNTIYINCISENSRRYGFFFENSADSIAESCQSINAREASFAIVENDHEFRFEMGNVEYLNCMGQNSPIGVFINGNALTVPLLTAKVKGCTFEITEYTVSAMGKIQALTLTDNLSNTAQNNLSAVIEHLNESDNSRN